MLISRCNGLLRAFEAAWAWACASASADKESESEREREREREWAVVVVFLEREVSVAFLDAVELVRAKEVVRMKEFDLEFAFEFERVRDSVLEFVRDSEVDVVRDREPSLSLRIEELGGAMLDLDLEEPLEKKLESA